MARLNFALRMVLARAQQGRDACPYCESCLHHRLQRKYLLIEARQCVHCGLIFRYPTETERSAAEFYEHSYPARAEREPPSPASLAQLLGTGFAGTSRDKSGRIALMQTLRPRARVLDFGCSWGYSVYQLRNAGFTALGFEVSHRIAAFGRQHLQIEVIDRWMDLRPEVVGRFDIIYVDHVLEHLANLRAAFERFAELLYDGGLLLLFVPNCGGLLARRKGMRWRTMLGEIHTIAFTADWLVHNLPRHGFAIERIASRFDQPESLLDGEEITCIARANHAGNVRATVAREPSEADYCSELSLSRE